MESSLEVLRAIRDNNVEAFEKITQREKGVFSLCFGRFPLLSLCFLYDAKRIIRLYERRLNGQAYTFVPEEAQIFEDFRLRAQKSVRIYTDDVIVSPLEMLAAIGSPKLPLAYTRLKKNDQIRANIAKIFQIQGVKALIENDKLIMPKAPLSRAAKIMICIIAAFSIVFSALPLAAFSLLSNSVGTGSGASPYRISNVEQLRLMFKNSQEEAKAESKTEENTRHYLLSKDLILPNDFAVAEFFDVLDGGGRTIYIQNFNESMLKTLSGTLQNINFVIECDVSMSNNSTFIVWVNNGTIENVNVKIEAKIGLSNTNYAYSSIISHENNGKILNTDVEMDMEYFLVENAGAAFGAFAIYNYGTIDGCVVKAGSKIVAQSVDLAAFVLVNGGIISNCTNNALIEVSTEFDDWYALVGGIAVENNYVITDCFNYGDISVASSSKPVNATQRLYSSVGGIAYLNYYLIERCLSDARIFVSTSDLDVYAGGIVGFNLGMVNSCGSFGSVEGETMLSTAQIRIGGIIGYNSAYDRFFGLLVNSFSAAVVGGNAQLSYLGGLIGVLEQIQAEQFLGNYYFNQEHFGIGAYRLNEEIFVLQEDFAEFVALSSLEELKQTEVYWQ